MQNTEQYLFHYYPIDNISELNKEKNIKHKTIDLLFSENRNIFKLEKKFYNKFNLPPPYFHLHCLNFLLRDKKLWVSKCESLNDPFEFLSYLHKNFLMANIDEIHNFIANRERNPPTRKSWIKATKKAFKSSPVIKYRFSDNIKHYGVYSLCQAATNPLMWSYYASGHSGVCVRFKIHSHLDSVIQDKSRLSLSWYDDGPAFIFGKVHYYDEIVTITKEYYEYQKKYALDYPYKFREKLLGPMELIFFESALSKDVCWQHEEEFRLITLGQGNEITLKKIIKPNSNEPILELDAIIFGLQTPKNIKMLLKNSFGDEISYFNSFIIQGTRKLGVDSEKF